MRAAWWCTYAGAESLQQDDVAIAAAGQVQRLQIDLATGTRGHVGRQVERIADYATNIGEDIIYMEEGEIVRHVH